MFALALSNIFVELLKGISREFSFSKAASIFLIGARGFC